MKKADNIVAVHFLKTYLCKKFFYEKNKGIPEHNRVIPKLGAIFPVFLAGKQ